MRCFEDLAVGDGGQFGSHTVSAAEIIDFAKRYDPQSFHIDPLAAERSIFGGLVASGLHSAGIMNRLIVDGWLGEIANLGSPGLDAISLPQPVRPGDELRARVEILDLRASRSKPDRGIVHYSMQLLNQRDEIVLATAAVTFVRRSQVS